MVVKDYMASDQFKYYQNMFICIDITEGHRVSFSLQVPIVISFMAISKLFTGPELEYFTDVVSSK